MTNRYAPLEDRFWAKVQPSDGCWEWKGSRQEVGGYGRIQSGGVQLMAHRVSYEINVGAIPDELTIDHLCNNRGCVNPDHLEPVTRGENSARYARALTHCKWGHEFASESYVNSRGHRICLACHRRQYHEKKARRAVKP